LFEDGVLVGHQLLRQEMMPHYGALCGDGSEFEIYKNCFFNAGFGVNFRPLHKFRLLYESIRCSHGVAPKGAYILVKKRPRSMNEYVVVDGVHRASILKKLKISNCNVVIVKDSI
jgi:hypothetical protein